MPETAHTYTAHVAWTGNRGVGTTNRRAYSRDTETSSGAKPLLVGSSDPVFRGDAAQWNPEDLLLVSLSQCHLLWYLDLAARAGVVVVAYVDNPVATMTEQTDGAGHRVRAASSSQARSTSRSSTKLRSSSRPEGCQHGACADFAAPVLPSFTAIAAIGAAPVIADGGSHAIGAIGSRLLGHRLDRSTAESSG